ncbi:hypothetical protein VPH35_033354 [Triticum aestivum]
MSLSVALPQQGYYCHQCDLAITIAAPASRDDKVFCPVCAGGFVEELFDDEEPPNPIPHHQPHPDLTVVPRPALPLRDPPPPAAASSNPSNQFDVHLGDLLSGGATIQIVLEGSSFPSGFVTFGAGRVSLVDYFMGSGLKQLIQQLTENDPSRYGTLPAAKAAVAALPDVADCILPWLDLHNSSLSAAIYDHQRQAAAAAVAAPASPGGGPSPRVMVRRFRISLPSDQDAAGYGDYKNDGNASGRSYDDLD